MKDIKNITMNNQIRRNGMLQYLYDHISVFTNNNAEKCGTELLRIVRKRIDKKYVMTDMLSKESSCREVPEKYLWKGELAAMVFAVGCYRVRIGIRCYDAKGYEYGEPKMLTPLMGERFNNFRQYLSCNKYFENMYDVLLRADFSVRHISRTQGFQHLYGLPIGNLNVDVNSVITVKSSAKNSDNKAILCLRENYSGSSFSAAYCIICLPDNTIIKKSIFHSCDRQKNVSKWVIDHSKNNNYENKLLVMMLAGRLQSIYTWCADSTPDESVLMVLRDGLKAYEKEPMLYMAYFEKFDNLEELKQVASTNDMDAIAECIRKNVKFWL